ncbi:hypothetical protein EDD18DRAFT_1348257 [Armillaria luteobubalina]|uniref:Uncharacterized protein n=1 Tax=Armillaria luteobubalina TaxID=153913 RepID=A0AA39US83_9AGAR|nr:hypothetical protein EDD18DRAFT_1348257 [Armillaria luteobubalina]
MNSAAQSKQTDQLTSDRVAVPLLFLPLATTSPSTTTFHTMGQPFKWQQKALFSLAMDNDKPQMMTTTVTAYWTTTMTPMTHQEYNNDNNTHTKLRYDEACRMERAKVHTPTANDEDDGRALWGIDGPPKGVPDTPNNLPTAPLPDLPLGTPPPPNIVLSCPPQVSQRPHLRASPTLTSYSTMDDTTTEESIHDLTMDTKHPMAPIYPHYPHYSAHCWHPSPRPTSRSPAPPRTPTDPMSVHLPLFEWRNTAMDPVLPPDPAITCRLPTILIPALSGVPPAVQASPLPPNLTTSIFDSGESNDTLCRPPIIPLAVQQPS